MQLLGLDARSASLEEAFLQIANTQLRSRADDPRRAGAKPMDETKKKVTA